MKVSNSKKQLAKIIHENGGWPEDAEWAAQCKSDNTVSFFYAMKPRLDRGGTTWYGDYLGMEFDIDVDAVLPNWHQTILSRDEYFHLYPAPVKVVVENKTTCHLTVADKPTIEQLAADYRNTKDFADRKQQEADAAKADAEAKRAELVAVGKAIGLVLSVAGVEPDLQVGDEVECVESNIKRDEYNGIVGRLRLIDESDASTPYLVDFGGEAKIWCHEVKFVRRPSKGEANA